MSNNPGEPSFGTFLRLYRERSVDRRSRKILSQDSLARKLSDKRGLIFDRNAIGKWEANRRIVPVDDRKTLLDLLTILVEHGGITTIEEADHLLEVGNYRKLDEHEKININPSWKVITSAAKVMRGDDAFPDDTGFSYPTHSVPPEARNKRKVISSSLKNLVLKSWGELERVIAATKVGPQPSWPRVLVGLINGASDHWTTKDTLKVFLWLWLWLLTWSLIAPSLRWPFAGWDESLFAVVIYAVGTLLIPPLIAVMISPKNNQFWQKQELATNKILFLYVYQGASIGFHLGYATSFLLALFSYHLHLPSDTWFELAAALFPLVMGFIAAQLVPSNLWRTYGKLNLADGAIFFIFSVLGPIWGYFFLNFYTIFLAPIVGLTVTLLAATSLTAVMTWQQHRTGTTVLHAHWWLVLGGTILVLYEISIGLNWYIVAFLAGLIVVQAILLSRGYFRTVLLMIIGLFIVLGLVFIILKIDPANG